MTILEQINKIFFEETEAFKQELLTNIKNLWRDIYDSDREDFVYDIFKDYGIVLTDEEKEEQDISKLSKLNTYDLKDVYEMMGGE